MSTRGCVAIKQGGSWVGVYNHSDSYPTGLGKELWDYLKEVKDLKRFADELLSYDDWRNFRSGGVCQYCGKVGKGQPYPLFSSPASHDIRSGLVPAQPKSSSRVGCSALGLFPL